MILEEANTLEKDKDHFTSLLEIGVRKSLAELHFSIWPAEGNKLTDVKTCHAIWSLLLSHLCSEAKDNFPDHP